MEKLADLAQAHAAQNPRLATLKGYPHWARGRDLTAQERELDALAEFDKALAHGIEEAFLRSRMSSLLRLDRYVEAIADAEQVVARFPYGSDKDPVAHAVNRYRQWAHEQHRRGHTQRAIDAYTDLIEYLPDDTDMRYWRGVALDGLGRLDEALTDHRDVIDRDPNKIEAYKNADRLLARQKRWDEVLTMWATYIAWNPGAAEAYFERGGAHFHSGNWPAAQADAERACTLGKQEACVWSSRLRERRG